MSDNDGSGILVIGLILVFLFFGYIAIDTAILSPPKIEAVKIQLILDRISVTEVTINSPSVYFDIDDYDEFKTLLRERNLTEIHLYSDYYYIFNDDFTAGWRISWWNIYEGIE